MPAYKLTYFPVTALGEPIRAAFALGGIPFEDERLPGAEWGPRKSDPTSPFFEQQMPALEITDDTGAKQPLMFQSRAILRYVGSIAKYNGKSLYPEDPLERYYCDEVIEMVEDIRPLFIHTFGMQEDEQAKERVALMTGPEGKMFKGFQKLDKRLGKFKFAAGDAPSIADLYAIVVAHMFQQPSFLSGWPEDSLKTFTNILALKDRVMGLPPLAAYYKDAETFRAPFKVAVVGV